MPAGPIPALILAPVVTGLVAACCPSPRSSGVVGFCGSLIYGLLWINAPFIDEMSKFLVLLVCLTNTMISAFSIDYIAHEALHWKPVKTKLYFILFHAFTASMLASLCLDSLGLTWVAIECTTLVSALLVGFGARRSSLEAAWKYLVVCSLGIAFALFGLVLLYWSSISAGIDSITALSWRGLVEARTAPNPALAKIAFAFIVVGYGTKAGFAPMHTWLPDAHSQAPSPVSAMLSAVLLNCSLAAIVRCATIVGLAVSPGFVGNLLIGFGLISVGLASLLMLVQHDIKRFLAYSSVEHMGVMAVGLGLAFSALPYDKALAVTCVTAVLIHMAYHSISKGVLFSCAGLVIRAYKSSRLARIRGILKWNAPVGLMVLLGLWTLSGAPPLRMFATELTIARTGFSAGQVWVGVLLLAGLATAFSAIILQSQKILIGTNPTRSEAFTRPAPFGIAALALPLLALIISSIYTPAPVREFITAAADCVLAEFR